MPEHIVPVCECGGRKRVRFDLKPAKAAAQNINHERTGAQNQNGCQTQDFLQIPHSSRSFPFQYHLGMHPAARAHVLHSETRNSKAHRESRTLDAGDLTRTLHRFSEVEPAATAALAKMHTPRTFRKG